MSHTNSLSETTSSVTLPNITQAVETNGVLKYVIDNVNTSVVNAIRRTLLSDIPCFVFKTFPDSENEAIIHKNTCRFHNEILKQRLGCIPVHIKDLDTPVEDLRVIIKVKNDTDSIKYVTTKDFQIKDIKSNKFLSESEVNKIFPPSGPPSNGYILYTRLRPKISASVPGEEIDIESKISISSAKYSGMYNMCSTASYFVTPDPVRQNSEWAKIRDKFEANGFSKADIERERLNWFTHDAKRINKPNSFNFILESVGVYSNAELHRKACEIIIDKLEIIKNKAAQNTIEIINSKNTLPNCYDVILKNYDYTVGKIIEYILHSDYFDANKRLNFVGFIKEHPHEDFSIIRMSFIDDTYTKTEIYNMIEYACQVAQKIFNHISDI